MIFFNYFSFSKKLVLYSLSIFLIFLSLLSISFISLSCSSSEFLSAVANFYESNFMLSSY